MENTGNGLVLTDPEGNQYDLTGPSDNPEFAAIGDLDLWPYHPAAGGFTKAQGSMTVTIRDPSGQLGLWISKLSFAPLDASSK